MGKVRLKGEQHAGEHVAIVDPKVWKRTATLLAANAEVKPQRAGKPQEALLRDLLICEACQAPMVPTYTKRNKTKVRYYTCRSAQMRGWKSCPAKTLPAHEIEEAVMAQLEDEAIELASLGRISYDGVTRQVSMTLREGANVE